MSGGSSKSGSAQKWARPYAIQGAKDAQGVFQGAQANTKMLGDTVSGMVPGLAERFNAGNPTVDAAAGHYGDVLSGKYLSGNPHLDAIMGKVRSGVSDEVNSQFGLSGRYGSGAHTGVLADKLAEAETGLRYQDYSTQEGRMDNAAAQAPAIAQAGYTGLEELLKAAGIGAEIPFTGLDSYSGALANLFNGSKQKQGTLDPIMKGAGTAASAIAMSDRRLKTEIRKTGELEDGLGTYEWRYVWGGPVHAGVMADEVAELRPWALGPEVAGFASVNYGAL